MSLISVNGGYIDRERNAYVLRFRDPAGVLAAILEAQRVPGTPDDVLAVPFTVATGVKLRALGTYVPGTIRYKYHWPHPPAQPPFSWQITTAEFLTQHPRCFVFNSAGTGKTRAALWAYDFLKFANPLLDPLLVLCPKSCVRSVWAEEAKVVLPHMHTMTLEGDAKARTANIKAEANIYVANHHTLIAAGEPLEHRRWGAIVIDEATFLQTPSTQMFKGVARLLRKNPDTAVWLLTATPASQSPQQAYGLAKTLRPTNVGYTFTEWRDTVMFKPNPNGFKWVPRRGATEQVHKLLQPAIRIDKKECLAELPPITLTTMECPMDKGTQRLYDEMKREGLIKIRQSVISPVNAANLRSKLLQIASGVIIGEDGSHRLAIQNRMAILREAIETSDSKVIVCVTFTEAIHAVADALRKDYSVEVLNGEVTSASKRQQIINDFQNKPDPHILVIHPKTAGHGLTLTAASTIVWWSPTDSQEQYKQACERTDRPGQKHNQRIIHLCSSPTERYVYDKLASLGEQQIDLLSLYSA